MLRPDRRAPASGLRAAALGDICPDTGCGWLVTSTPSCCLPGRARRLRQRRRPLVRLAPVARRIVGWTFQPSSANAKQRQSQANRARAAGAHDRSKRRAYALLVGAWPTGHQGSSGPTASLSEAVRWTGSALAQALSVDPSSSSGPAAGISRWPLIAPWSASASGLADRTDRERERTRRANLTPRPACRRDGRPASLVQ